jgi:hypothetical protein
MSPKYFTIEEANKTLVLVSPIVQDIIRKRRKMISVKNDIKIFQEKYDQNIFAEEIQKLTKNLKIISKEITYHLEELEMIGCYLKDFELGIVDFPSVLNGRVIFLCWMFGEKEINSWHQVTKGVETRERIIDKFETRLAEKN